VRPPRPLSAVVVTIVDKVKSVAEPTEAK
jgi:hypothetical protein